MIMVLGKIQMRFMLPSMKPFKTCSVKTYLMLLMILQFADFYDLCAQDMTRYEQFWITAELRYSLNVAFEMKTKLEYRGVYDSGERWRGGNLTQEFIYFLFPTVDMIGAFRVFHTSQNDTIVRTEIRPTIGAKVDVLRKGRFVIDNHLRFEWRQFFFNYSELNDSSARLRNKFRVTFAVNRERPYLNKTFYLIAAFEFFMVRDEELKERFANRHRFEAGVGYRFDDNWRLVMTYYRQYSRNQIQDSFNTKENILQIKGIYTFLKQ